MNTKICPICQSPIPENAPGGLCPACVLRDADEMPAPGPAAPSIAEIAAAFPQLEGISLIGQGGMGFVYKARQPSLDRSIALKILAPALGRDPAFAERFAREARTLGKLQHPNIVTVFEHGESGGFFYLMMEFVDGVNLRQAMRAGRFSPPQALAIVPGICDALQYAHEQGVWHRDIKPENILLDREGRVKMADFGIARIVGDPQRDFTLTRTGNALGSAAYMAPEQHEKPHEVDHRADIYSLGVVIYEMLTGELPLGRFPAPSQRAAVDSRIDEIVFKTLEKERELRQQSATEVKTDMHRVMADGDSRKPLLAAPQGKGLGKLAFGLFLFGITIPFLLWIISERAAEAGFILSALMMLLTLVLGLFSFRHTLGKITVVCSIMTLLVYGAFIAFMSRGPGPIQSQGEQVETGNPQPNPNHDFTKPIPAPPSFPVPPRPPRRQAPEPTVAVEEVFRKAVSAANESDGEEFSAHMWVKGIIDDPIAKHGEDRPRSINPNLGQKTTLEMMALFVGEIVDLKVVSIEKSRVPIMNPFNADLRTTTPVAYATIRKSNGSFKRVVVTFRNNNGRWVGSEAWFPNYGAFSRIEFKPEKGDAATMLKTHLGSNTDFRAVEGKPGVFDVFGFDEDADGARANADKRVQELRASLDSFNLGKYLKVVAPAEKPELPYMGENEPLFDPEKP